MCRLVALGTLLLFSFAPACRSADPGVAARTAFERMAAEMPYLDRGAAIRDGTRSLFRAADPAVEATHFRILAELSGRDDPQDALLALFVHPNPKVRTLAAVALFDREDPSVLPNLAALATDEARTFDGHPELARDWLRTTGIGPPEREQTVGGVASEVVRIYMEASGFDYGIVHPTQPAFREYWAAREGRTQCVGWFRVALMRACRGISPTQPDCVPRVRALRTRIDALSADERSWVLLALASDPGGETLASEEEVVAACRTLGPDRMLDVLRRRIPSGDPDLAPRPSNDGHSGAMVRFVLRHALDVLRPSDSDAVLECARGQDAAALRGPAEPVRSAWWAVAAARLDPTRAAETLHATLGEFEGPDDEGARALLCATLWELCGDREATFVLDRLFAEAPKLGQTPQPAGSYIRALADSRDGRRILAGLVRDPRFDGLGWSALDCLVRSVNRWTAQPVVSDEELRKAWHPEGMGHFEAWAAESTRRYPEETAGLLRHLAEWRTRLRTSVPDWAPQGGR